MTNKPRSAGFLLRAADKFAYRLVIYFFLVLLAAILAFSGEVLLRPAGLSFIKQAAVNSLVDALAVVVVLIFLELFLRYRGRTNQLEAKARKADTMLSAIMDAVPDLVYIKDAEGRHLLANKAVEMFTGLPAQQLFGKTTADLMTPGLAAACMQSDREPVLTGKPLRVEERFETAEGLQIFDTIKTPLRDDKGRIAGIVGVSRNITDKLRSEEERRRLQGQLQQVQKMEALGHLAGGVAHDFNNILTAIMGYTSVLKLKRADDDYLVQKADQILKASQRARAVISGLFTFSSKQKIDTKPLDINEVVSAGGKLLLQFMNERIAIKTVCCKAPLTVMADQVQLERVLLNLAINAQDAMPDGGDLVLTTDSFAMGDDFIEKYGYGDAGNYALLTVSDSGMGISEENTKKIFEPFFTTKETGKGTGLGLAIAYGIIKQHRGYINISSAPGRGAKFSIYLPLTDHSTASP